MGPSLHTTSSHPEQGLLKLCREEGKILNGDYTGIISPYCLLTSSKVDKSTSAHLASPPRLRPASRYEVRGLLSIASTGVGLRV